MAYSTSGNIKKIFDVQTFNSGFTKREFVVTVPDKYPQDLCFGALKEKTSMLDDVNEGDAVTVHFDIAGREYNGRYYVNLNAWKLEKGSGEASSGDEPPIPEDTTDYSAEDDVPF
ncbi:MAG: DUF3127 domain-containing protein [Verrucomicrobiota bacterium]